MFEKAKYWKIIVHDWQLHRLKRMGVVYSYFTMPNPLPNKPKNTINHTVYIVVNEMNLAILKDACDFYKKLDLSNVVETVIT